VHVVHLYDGHEKVHGGRGSVPGVVWNVARETAAAGHDVTVLERQWKTLPASARHNGVDFERLDLSTGADEPWERVPYELIDNPLELARLVGDRTNFALAALRRLRSMEFDVLHVHLPFAANVLATLAPWLRDRMVYTAHLGELRLNAIDDQSEGVDEGGTADDSVDVPGVLERFSPDAYLAKRAAKTTVLNPSIEDGFIERGVSEERLEVVPNGVDIDRFGDVSSTTVERVRTNYGLEGSTVALFVGTVMPRKGVLELVRALDSVVDEEKSDLELVIAGEQDLDSEYAERVRSEIEERGLREHVTTTGFVPGSELPALYDLADIFVLPSLEEGFGMTVIEAMAAETPIAATRVGGVPRVVRPDRDGYLAAPGDPAELATALERLLEDPEARERFSENAKERAESYSWHGISQNFISIYQEVNV